MSVYHDYFQVNDYVIRGFFEEYDFLSNFYPRVVWFDGSQYPSVEHAYQAAKTLDKAAREPFQVGGGLSAAQAKREGKKLELRKDWEESKFDVMLYLVVQKFQNKELRGKLLKTGDRFLEETNHWGDNIWGRDFRADIGKNWLGEILMRARNLLQPTPAYGSPLKKKEEPEDEVAS